MLLEQFDSARKAVINPEDEHFTVEGCPETVVSIFSIELFRRVLEFFGGGIRVLGTPYDADGKWPVYEVEYKGKRIGFSKARVGAPACVGNLEGVLTMGFRRVVLLGNCGVLDRNIADCGIIIPTAAIRDEGTSYHYAPAADVIEVNRKHTDTFKAVCDEFGYPYVEGVTWTTDALFRETPAKIAARREMGAVCVEMECSAVQALCDFRGVEFFQFFYAGDNLDHSKWDPRSLDGNVRLDDKEKIALLAFELAARL